MTNGKYEVFSRVGFYADPVVKPTNPAVTMPVQLSNLDSIPTSPFDMMYDYLKQLWPGSQDLHPDPPPEPVISDQKPPPTGVAPPCPPAQYAPQPPAPVMPSTPIPIHEDANNFPLHEMTANNGVPQPDPPVPTSNVSNPLFEA